MSLGKQAKILAPAQVVAVMSYLKEVRHAERDLVIFLLSLKAGLRAKEIANLTWSMVTGPTGELDNAIRLEDHASKGRSGRTIPLNLELMSAMKHLHRRTYDGRAASRIVRTERSKGTTPQVIVNLFAKWYAALGFDGCSSHSGRRTFVTQAARKISLVGGSLRDVQMLAGHASLSTTQRYIEGNSAAQKRVVELL